MFRWQRAGLCPTYLGDKAPAGICGSGVVDALACLLELGLLDESGLLEEDPAPRAHGPAGKERCLHRAPHAGAKGWA